MGSGCLVSVAVMKFHWNGLYLPPRAVELRGHPGEQPRGFAVGSDDTRQNQPRRDFMSRINSPGVSGPHARRLPKNCTDFEPKFHNLLLAVIFHFKNEVCLRYDQAGLRIRERTGCHLSLLL